MEPGDWTKDESGKSNNSDAYRAAVREAELIMFSSGGLCLSEKWVKDVARLVVSHLAYGYNFGPLGEPAVMLAEKEIDEPTGPDVAEALSER